MAKLLNSMLQRRPPFCLASFLPNNSRLQIFRRKEKTLHTLIQGAGIYNSIGWIASRSLNLPLESPPKLPATVYPGKNVQMGSWNLKCPCWRRFCLFSRSKSLVSGSVYLPQGVTCPNCLGPRKWRVAMSRLNDHSNKRQRPQKRRRGNVASGDDDRRQCLLLPPNWILEFAGSVDEVDGPGGGSSWVWRGRTTWWSPEILEILFLGLAGEKTRRGVLEEVGRRNRPQAESPINRGAGWRLPPEEGRLEFPMDHGPWTAGEKRLTLRDQLDEDWSCRDGISMY